MMMGERVEAAESTQTIIINGQQYQIVSPAALQGTVLGNNDPNTGNNSSSVIYSQPGQTGGGSEAAGASNQSLGATPAEEARRRRIRLLKNQEAARECRIKKKEYIKCLENRVAVLENQNKALVEELRSLKELYTGQKN